MLQKFRLPPTVCLRITRNCNARCSFCLAPPDGSQPDAESLRSRLDWLLARGVRGIQFCGGEPTVHESLAGLISHAHSRGAHITLTTNGKSIPEDLPRLLRATGTRVRVSLHGAAAHHDAIVGPGSYEATVGNIGRLLRAGVDISLQSTVISGATDALDSMVAFCLDHRVRRLGILPFLPRGRGGERRAELRLSSAERRNLRERLSRKRRELSGRLDLRWIDLSAGSIVVVEPDGRVVLERASESMDRLLVRL